jgi:molybdate transport system substrate-binding protein
MMNRRQFLYRLGLAPFIVSGSAQAEKVKTQLVFYCGVTMAKAMSEIADLFKREYPLVDVVILRGGSQDLYDTIVTSAVGDLYLPGEPDLILNHRDSAVFSQSVEIGFNQAALMVSKGNPKGILPELSQLLRKDLVTVLATPQQGAIGIETQQILEKLDLYEQAIAHASVLMADGRSLTQAIQRGEADVCLNWRSAGLFAIDLVDILQLPESIAPKRALLLTKLAVSQQSALADAFIAFASGSVGRTIMRRHGFLDRI